MKWLYYFIKRLCDIVIGLLGCILLIPVSLGVKLANMINGDFGPLIFANKRIGKNGKVIKIYKYRSMCVNAEAMLEDLMRNSPKIREEYLTNHKLDPDPRVTKVGRFIRKTSIDELPQFINVLLGNMSVVGPRPYLPREKEDMGEAYDSIVECKPGITGPWQVGGRNDTDFESRIKMDVEYKNKRNIWMDIKIFFKTIKVVLFGRGAK